MPEIRIKPLSKFFPWIIVGLFVLATFYYIFIWQKLDSNRLSVRGQVKSIEKKRGGHYIIISEGPYVRYLSYSIVEGINPDIHVGDSVFKEKGSKTLYIKSAKDGITRKAYDQDYLLGK